MCHLKFRAGVYSKCLLVWNQVTSPKTQYLRQKNKIRNEINESDSFSNFKPYLKPQEMYTTVLQRSKQQIY